MSSIETDAITIDRRVSAIVQFGRPTTTSGMRPAEYYQVTIDPNMASPGGEFIRFNGQSGDEIHGWQRVEALTVCEVLGDAPDLKEPPEGYEATPGAKIKMRAIVNGE